MRFSFVKALGSLPFAIGLIAALTVTLIASTWTESAFGTAYAQRLFYQAGWFDALLALFALNIFCATLTRIPFKKRHTGFVVTHIGLLLLLAGSLLSRWGSVDGQLLVYEGERSGTVSEERFELLVHDRSGPLLVWPLPAGVLSSLKSRGSDGSEVTIDRVWMDAEAVSELREGGADAAPNAGVTLVMSSERVRARETVTLSEKHPHDRESWRASMGPAVIQLKEKPAASLPEPASPTLRLTRDGTALASVPLDRLPSAPLRLEGTDITLRGFVYYPDARVEDNRLVTVSQEPNNPAVEFVAEDSKGGSWRLIRFALFPEFESMHAKKSAPPFKAEIAMPASDTGTQAPTLTIFHDGGNWSYESKSSKGAAEGAIEAGKTYSAGWMDFTFTVEKLYERAVFERRVRHALGGKGRPGVEVRIRRPGKPDETVWALEEQPVSVGEGEDQRLVLLRRKRRVVPFELTLKDFRKVDYPGTSQPASYESDVVLHDEADKVTIGKTIRMNQPLDYKGFRIFQSSYIQDGLTEASVFTVAKNPGIGLIYAGSVVMFLGVFLTFFVPPLSSFKH